MKIFPVYSWIVSKIQISSGHHQAHEEVQAKSLGGEAGDGKGSIGTMDPPIPSGALTATMIELLLLKDIAFSEDASIIVSEVPSRLVTDQPTGPEGDMHEKNSIECVVGRAGRELMIMDLRDLTLQSPKTNI